MSEQSGESTLWKGVRNASKMAAEAVGLSGGKAKSAVEQRREGEGKTPKAGAGRGGRPSTGRTEVFNTKLRPEFRAKLFSLAKQRGIGVAAVLEEGFAELEALRAEVASLRSTVRRAAHRRRKP
jgi:hypothetical protein